MKWLVNGEEHDLEEALQGFEITAMPDRLAVRTAEGTFTALVASVGGKTLVSFRGHVYEIEKPTPKRSGAGGGPSTGEFKAPMPGAIVDVMVAEGEKVVKGQKLLILEAMKTQQPVISPYDGTVELLSVHKGQQISEGDLMIRVAPDDK